ncbi:anti-sigma factor family protein [Streptomyces sp. NPDC087901]|uniref:anti-sigma factor family protein n=1 Tax=Streptomyces sp. NPDC087901 TaxID=3365818 RepID=UPI003810EBC5
MTPTTDTTRHPDVSEISDLTEGLLSASDAADVQRHLADCELCADVHASLEEIRSLLGALPAPEPMPSDIADRIGAALAEEARSAREVPEAADVSRETASASTSPEPADRPAGHSRAATGPGRRPARRRRRAAVLGAALGAAVVGASIFLLQNVQLTGNSSDSSAMDRGAALSKSASGTFSPSTLEGRVQSLLGSRTDTASPHDSSGKEQDPSADTKSSPESQSSADSASPQSASPENPLRAPTVAVPSCIERGIGRNTPALALQRGTYEGTAAYLVVLPHPSDTSKVQAYVVDAACVGAEPAAKGKLLLTHAYARP